jgi:hypothetical protein
MKDKYELERMNSIECTNKMCMHHVMVGCRFQISNNTIPDDCEIYKPVKVYNCFDCYDFDGDTRCAEKSKNIKCDKIILF